MVKRGGRLVSLLEQPPQEKAQERDIRALNNAVLPTNEHLKMIARLIGEGQVRAVIGKQFSLSQAHQAHKLSQTGHGRGRIVLQIKA